MIELVEATKRYGSVLAVDRVSFTVLPGHVTGFLGPNGAGKSTTLRLIVGLDGPTSGAARVNGRPYVQLPAPLAEVGTLLDARAFHPGRSARNHLRVLARSNRIPERRVDEVLALAGLEDVADRRAGGFSLGMGQRLGMAAALLGDPSVLVLDEPVNGLDAEGIRWVRRLLRGLADEGRTVLLSSHLMSEMELTADRLIVIGRGRLLADTTMSALIDAHSGPATLVRSPQAGELRQVLERLGTHVGPDGSGGLRVEGMGAERVGALAAGRGITLHELRPVRSSLEDAYTAMTAAAFDHRAGDGRRNEGVVTGRPGGGRP